MSLNWKEINLILEELNLEGAQIQGVAQSAFDVIILKLYKRETKNLHVKVDESRLRVLENCRVGYYNYVNGKSSKKAPV